MQFGKPPEPIIQGPATRVMSLRDGSKKMSKSDEDANATVFLSDSDDAITKKIKKAVTDSGSEIVFSPENPEKAGVTNLISIQAAITGRAPEEIVALVELQDVLRLHAARDEEEGHGRC